MATASNDFGDLLDPMVSVDGTNQPLYRYRTYAQGVTISREEIERAQEYQRRIEEERRRQRREAQLHHPEGVAEMWIDEASAPVHYEWTNGTDTGPTDEVRVTQQPFDGQISDVRINNEEDGGATISANINTREAWQNVVTTLSAAGQGDLFINGESEMGRLRKEVEELKKRVQALEDGDFGSFLVSRYNVPETARERVVEAVEEQEMTMAQVSAQAANSPAMMRVRAEQMPHLTDNHAWFLQGSVAE